MLPEYIENLSRSNEKQYKLLCESTRSHRLCCPASILCCDHHTHMCSVYLPHGVDDKMVTLLSTV